MAADGDGDVVAAAVVAVAGIGVNDAGLRAVVIRAIEMMAAIVIVMIAVVMMMAAVVIVVVIRLGSGSEGEGGEADRREEKEFWDVHKVCVCVYLNRAPARVACKCRVRITRTFAMRGPNIAGALRAKIESPREIPEGFQR